MAMTPAQIDAMDDYTAAQHLKMWKRADIEVAQFGQSQAIAGRSLNRADAGLIRGQIEFWQEQVNADDAGGGIALVNFGEPR